LIDLITMATAKDEADRDASVALLPVGSFEQHGDHLPLATDTIVACVIAQELARAYPVMLLSPVTISCSHEHAAWRGTVSISARTPASGDHRHCRVARGVRRPPPGSDQRPWRQLRAEQHRAGGVGARPPHRSLSPGP
jgi:Creatinine amidohydrolase